MTDRKLGPAQTRWKTGLPKPFFFSSSRIFWTGALGEACSSILRQNRNIARHLLGAWVAGERHERLGGSAYSSIALMHCAAHQREISGWTYANRLFQVFCSRRILIRVRGAEFDRRWRLGSVQDVHQFASLCRKRRLSTRFAPKAGVGPLLCVMPTKTRPLDEDDVFF